MNSKLVLWSAGISMALALAVGPPMLAEISSTPDGYIIMGITEGPDPIPHAPWTGYTGGSGVPNEDAEMRGDVDLARFAALIDQIGDQFNIVFDQLVASRRARMLEADRLLLGDRAFARRGCVLPVADRICLAVIFSHTTSDHRRE